MTELSRALGSYINTHNGDLSFVHGDTNHLGIHQTPPLGEYSLIQPQMSDLDLMLEADFLAQFCMDKRQVAQVHEGLEIDGENRILLTNAGGGEQRGARLQSNVNFWTQLIIAAGGNVNLALGIHIDGCGGAKVMEGEGTVNGWIKNRVEKTKMLERARAMRDLIWKRTRRQGEIEIACANVVNDDFRGITWHR